MMRISPVLVEVRCGLFDGTPKSIRMGLERLPVLGLRRVRQERAAFPADAGPRTVFEVDTPDARLSLAFAHRTRRWSVEGMDPDATAPVT